MQEAAQGASRITGLAGRTFDVVIVGAGINGSSAAQHLAAAGYDVLAVDKGDFCSGSSSRSSKLLHCGLRYLAPGRSIFDFVRHPSRLATALRMARLAMQARAAFVETTPERAKPFRLHFPVYRDGPYAKWQMEVAFGLLRALGPASVPLDYKMLSPADARSTPLIGGLRDADKLDGVAAFREYRFDWPERIGIEALADAERMGATVVNYASARMQPRNGAANWSVELTDLLSQTPPVTVHARKVVNMAGIWMDPILKGADPKAGRKIFGTKGAHIVVRLPPECRDIGIATLNSLQLPFYCLPLGDLHYFGPTETEYTGDPDSIAVTGEEQEFLRTEANRLLPGLALKPSDIIMTWAGVRPLTYDEAVPFGNRSRILHDLAGEGMADAFAMTAGPVMTHRSAGEEVVAALSPRMAPSRPARAPDYSARAEEIGFMRPHSLTDVLFRRTGAGWTGPLGDDVIEQHASRAAAELGWSAERKEIEIRNFRTEWARLYAPRGRH